MEGDYTQAFYWYQKSAKAGNKDGMNALGRCYEDGIGVTKDETQAAYWFSKAEENE